MKRSPGFYKRLGAKIREARKNKGWSQHRLGKSVGMTRAWTSSVENGRVKIDAELLLMVGKKLGL